MKKSFIYLGLSLASVLFTQCSSEEKIKETESVFTTQSSSEEVVNPNAAVCIWEKVVVRETPEEKGKYVTSVNLAERVELLGEEKTDESGSKKREYCKIKLMDGKEGWVIKDFIVAEAKPGALVNDVEVYTRPDLLAKTNKMFKRMDIVAVSDVQGEWCKIKGKRTGGTWMEEGWVKTNDLTYDQKDLAVALYGKQAMAASLDKRAAELAKIIDNKDFDGSVFLTDFRNMLAELTAANEPEIVVEEAENAVVPE